MKVTICKNAQDLGAEASGLTGQKLREAIAEKGEARIILATGSSQFETLEALLKEEVDWSSVEIFHLDEYIGLPETHKASFRKYLRDRFVSRISCRKFHAVDTGNNLEATLAALSHEILKNPVDVGMIGIGVNGHIAFNDPPADFETVRPYIEVFLDDKCKMQQVDEGWFENLEEVPDKAVTMSVNQIMQCRTIISAVPHSVKADAVYQTFTRSLTNLVPATMLKQHPDFNLFLDTNSASRIISL